MHAKSRDQSTWGSSCVHMLGVSNTLWFDGIIYIQDLSKLSFFLHLFSLLEKSDIAIWFYAKFWSIQKDQKRIIRHDFAKTFSKSAPKNPIFKTPFFSIIERFQRFPKNFLLTKFFEMCLCVVQIWRRTYPPRGPLGFHFPPLIYEDFTSSKVKSCRVVKSLWAGFHKKYWKKWNSPERGAYDAKFERHITKYGWKQLKMSWFYVISYNLGLCRLVKRSKAASKTGQILLKNTNIGIETPCKRAVHTEIWNIWEIDCFFRPKPCNDLFI